MNKIRYRLYLGGGHYDEFKEILTNKPQIEIDEAGIKIDFKDLQVYEKVYLGEYSYWKKDASLFLGQSCRYYPQNSVWWYEITVEEVNQYKDSSLRADNYKQKLNRPNIEKIRDDMIVSGLNEEYIEELYNYIIKLEKALNFELLRNK